jgi:hypothetical protein
VWTCESSGSTAQQAESEAGTGQLRVGHLAAGAPRRTERAADVARSNDRNLDGSLLLRRVRLAGYLCLSRAYPMI